MDEALIRVTGDAARPADVPAASTPAPTQADRQGHGRLARRGRRQGGLHRRPRRRAGGRAGEQVILVRRETNPDDLHGMIAAQGILTSRAARPRTPPWSPAAWARPASAAPRSSRSTPRHEVHRGRRHRRQRGRRDLHRRHHRRGLPRRGAGRAVAGGAVLRGRPRRRTPTTLVAAVHRIMRTPTSSAGSASGPTPTPARTAARARRFGAAGHRPVPDRAHVPRRAPAAGRAADPGRDRRRAARPRSTRCSRCSASDFVEILEAMDGLPVTIRLIDPPLHEFLPDLTELSVKVALARRRGRRRAGPAAARRGPPPARAEPDAGPARRPARPGHPRPVRRCRSGPSPRPRPSWRRRAATRGRRS